MNSLSRRSAAGPPEPDGRERTREGGLPRWATVLDVVAVLMALVAISVAIGIAASVVGLGVSRVAGSAPSGTIVLVAAGVFVVVAIASRATHRIRGTVEADV